MTEDEIHDAAFAAYCRGAVSEALFRVMWSSQPSACIGWSRDELISFAKQVAAAEREACAKACDEKSAVKGGEVFAARIRARGQA